MAYKNIEHNFSFSDTAAQKSADQNRSMLFLHQVNNSIGWHPIQEHLLKYYDVGKKKTEKKNQFIFVSVKKFTVYLAIHQSTLLFL